MPRDEQLFGAERAQGVRRDVRIPQRGDQKGLRPGRETAADQIREQFDRGDKAPVIPPGWSGELKAVILSGRLLKGPGALLVQDLDAGQRKALDLLVSRPDARQRRRAFRLPPPEPMGLRRQVGSSRIFQNRHLLFYILCYCTENDT